MNKEEYYSWVAENDTYPTHGHKFIVALYTGGRCDTLHRYLGTFETKEEAKSFAKDYKDKYTKPGFI
jgi:tripartite-type tricarboxylate transporter receptor subunit TctC